VTTRWFLALLLGAGVYAYGGTVTFNFTGSGSNTLAAGATTASIATYMTNALVASGCVGCSVTVNNGLSGLVYVDSTYNGEGHVVAPGTGGAGTKSTTLGTTEGAATNSVAPGASYDNFISNVSDGSSSSVDRIALHFNGLTLQGTVSFDFEIFPDGACPVLNSTSCGGAANGSGIFPNQPDLQLQAGLNGADSLVNSFGTAGVQYGKTPVSSGGGDGTSTHSPLTTGAELSPQWIGTWSTATALNGNNDLNFLDWPAAIGIDNLTINYSTTGGGGQSSVPEPGSVILLTTVIAGLMMAKRKLRKV